MSIDGLNKEELIKKLNKILITDIEKYKDGLVISIDGVWGVGKTVFWKEYVIKHLVCKDNKCKYKVNDIAYVSLFGKDSIEAINSEILLKVSREARTLGILKKVKENYSPALKEINKMTQGIGGVLGSAALSILSDADFRDKIICFDDFERISDNISHKDVMGLISSLKEDKKCKIVMIMHQDKMESKNREDSSYDITSTKLDDKRNVSFHFNTSKAENNEYTEYKEKIVDVELFYSPSIDSLFNVVKNNIEYEPFKEYTIKYLKDTNIKNIRVMKRIVTALNDFSFIKDWDFLHKNSEIQIAENILEVSTIYALYHFSDLDSLYSYTSAKATHHMLNIQSNGNMKNFIIDEKKEAILDYINYNREYIITPVAEVLEKYVKTSIVDKEKLRNIIEEDSIGFFASNLYDEIIKLGREYLKDLSYSSIKYSEKLYSLLQKDIKKIISLVKPNNFLFYIEELIKIDKDREKEYKELLITAGKYYIDDYLAKDYSEKSYRESEYDILISSNQELKKYADDKSKKTIEENRVDLEVINKAIINISTSTYFTSDIDLLKFISKDECKNFLLTNIEFTEYSFDFLRKTSISELDSFRENLINALKELAEDNQDLKYRIERIFKISKINI